MTNPFKWRRRAFGLATVLALLGCNDDRNTTGLRQAPERRSVSDARASAPESWDTFVTDVVASVTRYDAKGVPLGGRAPIQYRYERRLMRDGRWSVVTTFARPAPLARRGLAAVAPANEAGVARIEHDGDGAMRFYDFDGKLMPTKDVKRPELPPVESSKAWLQSLMLSPDSLEQRKAKLSARYGRAARAADGLDEFVVSRDSITLTIGVDPAIGAVTRLEQRVRGQVLQSTSIAWSRDPSGNAFRSSIRTDTPADLNGKNVERTVTETRFSNVHVEKRG